MTGQAEARPADGGTLARWLTAADLLFGDQGAGPGEHATMSDQVSRVIAESASPALIAEAFAKTFRNEVQYVEKADIRRAIGSHTILAWDHDRNPFVILGRSFGGRYRIIRPGPDGTTEESTITRAVLHRTFVDGAVFERTRPLAVWAPDGAFTDPGRWFWDSIRPLFSSMRYLAIAAVVGNLLAVAASLFALQVWDRVIPAQSVNSLTVLVIGVMIAVVFELILRLQRAALIDDVGRGVVDCH
jgi:ABC-type bacteriocin/lantibiotic exporter with double-glycine peptidase domain